MQACKVVPGATMVWAYSNGKGAQRWMRNFSFLFKSMGLTDFLTKHTPAGDTAQAQHWQIKPHSPPITGHHEHQPSPPMCVKAGATCVSFTPPSTETQAILGSWPEGAVALAASSPPPALKPADPSSPPIP